jgi:hypothetical protein
VLMFFDSTDRWTANPAGVFNEILTAAGFRDEPGNLGGTGVAPIVFGLVGAGVR